LRATNVILTLAFAMSSSASVADPPPRFPNEHITLADWQAYLGEVKLIPDVHCDVTPKSELYCLSNSRASAWVFTTEGHPAHPAVVTGVLATYGLAAAGIMFRAYYAGSESAFRAWEGYALGNPPIFQEWQQMALKRGTAAP
jgi:hypothetical protein